MQQLEIDLRISGQVYRVAFSDDAFSLDGLVVRDAGGRIVQPESADMAQIIAAHTILHGLGQGGGLRELISGVSNTLPSPAVLRAQSEFLNTRLERVTEGLRVSAEDIAVLKGSVMALHGDLTDLYTAALSGDEPSAAGLDLSMSIAAQAVNVVAAKLSSREEAIALGIAASASDLLSGIAAPNGRLKVDDVLLRLVLAEPGQGRAFTMDQLAGLETDLAGLSFEIAYATALGLLVNRLETSGPIGAFAQVLQENLTGVEGTLLKLAGALPVARAFDAAILAVDAAALLERALRIEGVDADFDAIARQATSFADRAQLPSPLDPDLLERFAETAATLPLDGTRGNDTLIASGAGATIRALAGNDTISVARGRQELRGDTVVYGGAGKDEVRLGFGYDDDAFRWRSDGGLDIVSPGGATVTLHDVETVAFSGAKRGADPLALVDQRGAAFWITSPAYTESTHNGTWAWTPTGGLRHVTDAGGWAITEGSDGRALVAQNRALTTPGRSEPGGAWIDVTMRGETAMGPRSGVIDLFSVGLGSARRAGSYVVDTSDRITDAGLLERLPGTGILMRELTFRRFGDDWHPWSSGNSHVLRSDPSPAVVSSSWHGQSFDTAVGPSGTLFGLLGGDIHDVTPGRGGGRVVDIDQSDIRAEGIAFRIQSLAVSDDGTYFVYATGSGSRWIFEIAPDGEVRPVGEVDFALEDFLIRGDAAQFRAAIASLSRADGPAGAPVIGTKKGETLAGTSAPERIEGRAGTDTLVANGGADRVQGGAGDDTLHGMAGNDTLEGGSGFDTLWGGSGDDVLTGGADGGRLIGGQGSDTYLVSASDGGVNIEGETSESGMDDTLLFTDLNPDEVRLFRGDFRHIDAAIKGFVAFDRDSRAHIEWIEFADGTRMRLEDFNPRPITGTGASDLLRDGAGDTRLEGKDGDDALHGGGGDDTLLGGPGNDTLIGGEGDDRLDPGTGDGRSWQRLEGGNGSDLYTLPKFAGKVWIEDQAHGNVPGGWVQLPETARKRLDFSLDGDGATGVLRISGPGGLDVRIQNPEAFGPFSFGRETVRLYDLVVNEVTGTRARDTIEGTYGMDSISGRNGADILDGRGGTDTLHGQSGADLIIGGAGRDSLLGGAGRDTLTGGGGDDTLDGGDGRDVLIAGSGSGRGVQVLVGGRGSDAYVVSRSGGAIEIRGETGGADDQLRFTDLMRGDVDVSRIADNGSMGLRLSGPDGFSVTVEDAASIEGFVFADGGTFGLEELLPTPGGAGGIRIIGLESFLSFAPTLGGGADINGDGIDDLLIGMPTARDPANGQVTGAAIVLYGSAGLPSLLAVGGLDGNDGFRIQGENGTSFLGDFAGGSVSFVGDLDGDGRTDMVIGAEDVDRGGGVSGDGRVYVVSGRVADGRSVLDLGALAEADGFRIDRLTDAEFGTAVSGAGDVNGDGFADFVVGADRGPGDSAWLFLGGADIFSDGAGPGTRFSIGKDGTGFGTSVTSLGDFNGDGRDDFAVSAPDNRGLSGGGGSDDAEASGSAIVPVFVVGGRGGAWPAALDPSTPNVGTGLRIEDWPNSSFGDQFGAALAGPGDISGDGLADLLIGVPWADPLGRNGAGEVLVVQGRSAPFDASQTRDGLFDAGVTRIFGAGPGASAGSSVAGAGDVDRDGRPDILIGASADAELGRAYLVFASALAGPSFDLRSIDGTNGFRFHYDDGRAVGGSVASAGDLNADGFADFAIGAWDGSTGAPRAFVVFGGAANLASLDTRDGRADGNIDLGLLGSSSGVEGWSDLV